MMPPDISRTDNYVNLGFDSSWELDFWGRIRRSVESADAGLQASIEGYRDVLVLLYSSVASAYVDVRTLQARIQYTEGNLRSQNETLQLTKDRRTAGLAPDLDVSQAELNTAQTESSLPLLRQALAQSIHRLGVLLGELPSALVPELSAPAPLPTAPASVTAGLPADLLRQRPDVREAERELAAQTARIGVAKADLYPRFSLSGTFVLDATDVGNLFTGAAKAWGFGPTFRWNLFDGGRVRSAIRVEEARTEQALTFYEQTVLNALEDVENAMVAYAEEKSRVTSLVRSVVAAQKSVDLVKILYTTGLTNFQNVLDMERKLFLQQDQLAESRGIVILNLIRIYRALGGGWQAAAATANPPSAPGGSNTAAPAA